MVDFKEKQIEIQGRTYTLLYGNENGMVRGYLSEVPIVETLGKNLKQLEERIIKLYNKRFSKYKCGVKEFCEDFWEEEKYQL